MTDETTPGPWRRRIAIAMVCLWAFAFFGSFLALALTPAQDFGLSQGWNKVGVFMGWQVVAAGPAFVCLMLARWFPARSVLRRLSLAPSGATAMLAVAVVALVIYANMARMPPAPAPDRPVTQTAPVTN